MIEISNQLYDRLGHDDFTSLFPCILTDNRTEFSNATWIENHVLLNEDGTIHSQTPRTKLFDCDPKSPEQKVVYERNHEFVFCFIPKGVSFDPCTPAHIQIMTNHFNRYKRKNKDGITHFHLYHSLWKHCFLSLGARRNPTSLY